MAGETFTYTTVVFYQAVCSVGDYTTEASTSKAAVDAQVIGHLCDIHGMTASNAKADRDKTTITPPVVTKT